MRQRTIEGNKTVLYEYAYQDPERGAGTAPATRVHQNYVKKQ